MDKNIKEELILLATEEDASTRNKLALRLAETGQPEVLDMLISLIKRDALKNHRGTLVSCLRNFEYTAHFPLLVELVITGNFEVAHYAFDLIAEIEEISGDDVDHAFKMLSAANETEVKDEWRKEMLQDLTAMFD